MRRTGRWWYVPAVVAAVAAGCAPESVQRASFAMDEGYRRFSEAYLELDPVKVAALYTEDALYLQPNGDMVRGRAAITTIFADFFRGLRQSGREARIFFTSVDRRISGPLGYDVGYYDLVILVQGEVTGRDRGKFVTVWKRGPYGAWRIHVDGYSAAPQAGGRVPDAVDVEPEGSDSVIADTVIGQ